ncbi:amidohydrolase family protein [Conexibacter woesei]|uniref:Cytosine deaminase n=1 Tax=Conexibacter woesei (strain DSM 14684 / CCUG 47730 / CIP 108061 / JCM 11494 / NBRC 100937 / ID131577) TaxID=469383 RepID=D3F1S0_CONWI|nr:amidohydrolase family protein [Conexibacter woesei]ADB54101.1 Cytosine deaminase [Conexibacter woesei DSM 14684]
MSAPLADLVIAGARLHGHDGLVDVVVEGETIAAAGPRAGDGRVAVRRIEARGGLVTPSFVEPHTHPDKSFSRSRIGEVGFADDLMRRQVALKAGFTVADVEERATRFFTLAAAQGIGLLRAQVDIDSITRLVSFEGVMRARERCRDLLDVHVTAFPQEGLMKDAAALDLLRVALRDGADCVSGWPNNENSKEDELAHLDLVFELSQEFGVPIDANIDYFTDPTERMLEPMAERTLALGMGGRVSANHVGALETYADADAARVIAKVAEAGVSVTICPTNLSSGTRYRGVSRPHELRAAGVNVTAGTGNFHDNWESFGNLDPADLARLAYHALGLSHVEGVDLVWEMLTVNAARALGTAAGSVAAGQPADLVVFEAADRTTIVRGFGGARTTVKRGRVVAGRTASSWVADLPAASA